MARPVARKKQATGVLKAGRKKLAKAVSKAKTAVRGRRSKAA